MTIPEELSEPTQKPSGWLPSLYVQVLLAVIAGALLGWLAPSWGVALKPVGELFVRLVKMLIAPIVFTTVIAGIAGMGDLKKVGRVGAKAVLYFEAMTTLALVLGLGVVHLVRPGEGMHVRVETLDTHDLQELLDKPHPRTFVEHVMAMVPESFVGAFTSGDVLQVLLIAVLGGIAVAGLGARGKPVLAVLEQTASLFFALVGVVMRLAPIGAFGAMAFTIGKYGVASLGNLFELIAAFYVTALLFVFVVLAVVMRIVGLSVFRLVRYLREELAIVLGTSSSESALPRLMAKLEHLGCAPDVVRLVVPTGYSFNLDGTCIYLTMAAVFVAQATDTHLGFEEELLLLGVLLLTSKGAAGVTGSGFITLAATLGATGSIPVAGLALLLGIDRFMSEARALTNLVGNAVATIVVARWEGALDVERAQRVLRERSAPGS